MSKKNDGEWDNLSCTRVKIYDEKGNLDNIKCKCASNEKVTIIEDFDDLF